MTRRTLQLAQQLHTNAIRLLDYVAVGDDVTFGIHNHAGAERMLADGAHVTALAALAAEELVKEILEGGVFIAAALILVWVGVDVGIAPPMRVLNRRLGIDVDYARLELLGNLGKGVRELLRSGNGQRRRDGRLLALLAFHSIGDNRSNQNSNCQRRQNRKSVRPTVGFKAHPKGAFARIHRFLLKLQLFIIPSL